MNPFSKPTNIIITIIVAALITAGIIVGLQALKREVTITLDNADYKVTLYEGTKESGRELSTLTATQTFSLNDGYYCYVISGEKYSDKEDCFSVYGKDASVKPSPIYSTAYLNSALDTELPAITQSIEQAYGATLSRYESARGVLMGDADWYIGTLKEKTANPGEIFDTYVYILNKKGGVWTIAAKPSFVMSAVDNNTIPKSVIDAANTHLTAYVKTFDY